MLIRLLVADAQYPAGAVVSVDSATARRLLSRGVAVPVRAVREWAVR